MGRRSLLVSLVFSLMMAGGTAAADEAPLPGANAGQLRAAFHTFPAALNELAGGPRDHVLYDAVLDGRLFFNTIGGVEVCHGQAYGAWAYSLFESADGNLSRIHISIDDTPLEIESYGPRRVPGGVFFGSTHFTAEGVPVLDDWALDYGEHGITFEFGSSTIAGSYTVVDC